MESNFLGLREEEGLQAEEEEEDDKKKKKKRSVDNDSNINSVFE